MTNLITGTSGHLGKRIAEILGDKAIGGSRNPKPGQRKVDFDDVASLDAAFQGIDRLLIVSTDAVDRPGRRFEQHERAVAAAKRAGVKHIVYTSLAHPDEDSPVLIAPDHRKTEALLKNSGIPHTVLRNNLYTENLLHSLAHVIQSGKLVAAAADGKAAYVTREDCAQAAAAALIASTNETRVFEITGPAAIGHAELAEIISAVAKKKVEYVAVPPAALKDGLIGAGLPPAVADLLVSFDVGIARGKLGPATDAVKVLTGREPQSYRAFLEAQPIGR